MAEANYKILIVEDDLSIRDAMKEFLSAQGYEVDTASDGQSAIEAVKKKCYNIAILDLMLPGMNGIDVLKSFKQVDAEIVVIIMTGYATLESAILAIKEGAYDYLTKPFKLDEIRIAVKNACEKVFLRSQHKVYVDELRKVHADKPPTEEAESAESSSPTDVVDELERLERLMERGIITKEEFNIIKSRIFVES